MILDSLSQYRESLLPERQHFFDLYRPLDVAFRVVGTGSVGLRDYIVYLEGNGSDDPLFLQIKEEPGSAYAPYLGEMGAPQHQGRRVVAGPAGDAVPLRHASGLDHDSTIASTWFAS